MTAEKGRPATKPLLRPSRSRPECHASISGRSSFQNEARAQLKLTVPLRRWLICWLGHQISPWGYALFTALAISNGRPPLCIDGRRQCLLEDDTSPTDTFSLFIYYMPSQLLR